MLYWFYLLSSIIETHRIQNQNSLQFKGDDDRKVIRWMRASRESEVRVVDGSVTIALELYSKLLARRERLCSDSTTPSLSLRGTRSARRHGSRSCAGARSLLSSTSVVIVCCNDRSRVPDVVDGLTLLGRDGGEGRLGASGLDEGTAHGKDIWHSLRVLHKVISHILVGCRLHMQESNNNSSMSIVAIECTPDRRLGLGD